MNSEQIQNKILEWIGVFPTLYGINVYNSRSLDVDMGAYKEGYEQALQDLRNKVPELVKKIVLNK